MLQYWVEDVAGQRYGPADAATLRLWAGQGRVVPETPLLEVETGARLHAGELLAPADFAAMSAPAGSVPRKGVPCPNCHRWLDPSVSLCPNCGYVIRPAGTELPGRLLTGLPTVDTALGLLTVILLLGVLPSLDFILNSGQGTFYLLIPILLAPLGLYLALRRRLPAFARGLGGGLLLGCISVPILITVGLASLIHQWATTPWRICNW